MTVPYISLGMMLGDAHIGVLERCLRSVLERSSGPLVEEIVLGWNGTQQEAFAAALEKLGYTDMKLKDQSLWCGLGGYPSLKVVPFSWPGRFDTARNIYWKHLTGEWLLWLDADDVVADAGTPKGLAAIEQVEKDYGLPPMPATMDAPITLKTWLSSLPPKINVIFSPYNYTVDANDYVQVRQKMKRIVRRSAGHIWHSPEQSGVHELLTCIGGVPETMAETFGLLVQHYPSQEELTRVTRNRSIVEQLTRPGVLSDPRHAYDVANAALAAGNLVQANEAISQAIIHAHNDMDRYTYRLARAYIGSVEGNPEKMQQEAFAAIGLMPELRDAYFIACEAYYRLGKWLAVIEWFERGVSKTPALLSRDQPLAAFTAPRAQAALAYTYIGLAEKALELISQMEKEYPKAGLTVEAGLKVRALIRQQQGEVSLFTALEFVNSVSPSSALRMVEGLRNTHAFDVLRTGVQWAALERKIIDAGCFAQHTFGLKLEDGLAFLLDRGRINIDDVLDRLDPSLQLLSAEPVQDKDGRALKVETRLRPRPGPGGRGSPTDARRIAFYAPIGITRWEPAEYDTFGMGGSESSVALLARELVDRGHRVTVFTNKPTVSVTSLWRGVIQKDCTQYRPHEWAKGDTVVFCRAPWMAREDPPVGAAMWCWHQDNGYANQWMWNPDVLGRQGHLFVSEFAALSLLKDSGAVTRDTATTPVKLRDLSRWCMLGNGIDPVFSQPRKRDYSAAPPPLRVVYASNPSRGLKVLLQAWPLVLAQEPEALLDVACEWNVMLNTSQEEPGFTIREKLQALQEALFASPRTTNHGWLPQAKLLELLRSSAVYAYPGGPMPEGFGVVLVQAAAAGCKMVVPEEGALPEVLELETTYWLDNKDPTHVAERIVRALRNDPLTCGPAYYSRHHWSAVADRFLAVTK